MNTYYELKGTIDGDREVIFGSFIKNDCFTEHEAERYQLRDQGYTNLKVEGRETTDQPDADVYTATELGHADANPADLDDCEICGDLDELSHNDETGLALCLKCDNENQPQPDPVNPKGFKAVIAPVHFYATCAIGWATAATRDEAIRKLVDANYSFFKDSIKPAQKRGDAGAYVWACQVNATIDTKYAIEYYAPRGVETEGGVEHFITHLTRKEIAYTGANS